MNINAQQTGQEDVKPEESGFIPDFRIAKLSAIGIIGFLMGCVFLFYDDLGSMFKTDAIFHEVGYQPRHYTEVLVNTTIDSLEKKVKATKVELNNYADNDTSKSIIQIKDSLNKKLKLDTGYIIELARYKPLYEDLATVDTNNFTELNKALHFQITPDSINKWDCFYKGYKLNVDSVKIKKYDSVCCIMPSIITKIASVNCYLKDKALPFKLSGEVDINIVKPQSDIEFISKYPAAGIWLILVLIFCSFCFTAIATAVYMKNKVGTIFTKDEKEKLYGKYYLISIITAVVMGLVALIWYATFYDDDIVKNLYFFKHLNVSMAWVIVLGSVAGAFCLAGFIYTASMVSYFATPFVKLSGEVEQIKAEIAKLQADIQQAAINQQAITTKQKELDDKTTALAEPDKNFKRLTSIFQNYFLLAAIILSVMVLCTGSLFNTINSLDFVKLLASDWGYSPVRSDYVYLYGGLYTIILLLVYIPAKMRFSEVDADVWGKAPVAVSNSKWYDFLKDPFGKMKDIVIATSPFLVSLIQSFFDALFK